jgi:hypothetical protein
MSRDITPGSYIECGNPTKLRTGAGPAAGTYAAWVWPDALSSGVGWIHTYGDQWGWGFNGANLRFTKFLVVDIPSTLGFVVGAWQFAAVVAAAANIRYLRMTADGVVTTRDVADGNTMTLGPTVNRIGTYGAEQGDMTLAHMGIWINQFLSDNELCCFARGVFPRQPTFYAPLWGATYPEADLTPDRASLTQVGAVGVRGQPPISPYLLAA